MRAIIASALPGNPVNLVFLLLFAAVFIAVAVYALLPSRKSALDEAARIPFND
jgi:cbb3-type cytochrome oxidase subunit 3